MAATAVLARVDVAWRGSYGRDRDVLAACRPPPCWPRAERREEGRRRRAEGFGRGDFYPYILVLNVLDLHTFIFFNRTCMFYRQLIFTPILFWTEYVSN